MTTRTSSQATILAVHPGAELFGSDRMFLESVIGMVDAGHHVVVALPEPGDLAARLNDVGALVTIAPMLVLRKSLLRPRGWGRLFRDTLQNIGVGYRLIRKYRPVSIYVSTLTLPLWPLLGRALDVRVVSHVHEAESTANRLIQKAMYMPHLSSTAVVVNSDFSAITLRASLPALSAKAEVVYNGVAAPSDPHVPRADLGGSLRVLYIGRISPRKGPDVAVTAVHYLRSRGIDAHLTLLGSAFAGYEWYERELRELVASKSLDPYVEFVGFEPDIWPRLEEADVLVVPSINDEPFGNTAVEGILALRPVIASDTSGLREAAGDYRSTSLVSPGDAAALGKALLVIFQDWSRIVAETTTSASKAESKHGVAHYRTTVARITVGARTMSGVGNKDVTL